MQKAQFDSIIFDMDGTLWDAVDSYCAIWQATFEQLNIKSPEITREELLACMGLPINEIFKRIVTIPIDADEYLRLLDINEKEMMPILGGKLYTGVENGIARLAEKYNLFMVSNCGAEGLHNFLNYTGLEQYFIDTLTYGETLKGKSENIRSLISRHNLKSPIYMGDTQGDCDSAHQAGIPMIYASYGFGKCSNAEYTFDDFSSFVDFFCHNQ